MIPPSARWAAVPRTSGAHDPRGVSRTGLPGSGLTIQKKYSRDKVGRVDSFGRVFARVRVSVAPRRHLAKLPRGEHRKHVPVAAISQ